MSTVRPYHVYKFTTILILEFTELQLTYIYCQCEHTESIRTKSLFYSLLRRTKALNFRGDEVCASLRTRAVRDGSALNIHRLRARRAPLPRRPALRIDAQTDDTNARARICCRLAAALQIGKAGCIIEAHLATTP